MHEILDIKSLYIVANVSVAMYMSKEDLYIQYYLVFINTDKILLSKYKK